MVSIIKNQLLKHLSRFCKNLSADKINLSTFKGEGELTNLELGEIVLTDLLELPSWFCKNLSADKINLSTFKGEGELTNLELDEIVLTDLLELPSWLRLTHAWCNKVSFRIQWTKLKSVPIFLRLDEVHIEVETCEDLRSPCSPQGASTLPGSAKYSFIHKVIDGITVSVNTVSVTFKSPAFVASVQISRIMVESKSPTWQRCDLRMTRVKDPDRGQLLIFKELEWQTVRIEAQSTKDKDLTPLRLLTNQARCRITIKKRISDCFVMGSRLLLILDDLLWVLTDSQLKAALHFIDSLGGLVERATVLERKTKAARKLEVLPEYQAQISQQARSKAQPNTLLSKIFTKYDVVETSYHFLSQRIDLHLCDDPGAGRSVHPDLKDGGALQISLVKFQIDYYPYHLAIADRKHWAKYKENATPHNQWLQQSMNSFRGQFMDLIDMGRTQHSPIKTQGNLGSSPKTTVEDLERSAHQQTQSQSSLDQKKSSQHGSGNPVKNYVLEQLAKLMTTCMVIKIDDFTIFKVTSSTRKPTTKEFIAGDRDKFCLPEDVTIVHAEFTYYYYPGDITFPLPPPKFYVQLNPLQINYDLCSCLWFNSFGLNLYHSLILGAEKTAATSSNLIYFDVKLEAILPRIVFEGQDYPNQRDRPKSLHMQTSRVTVTNVRSTERSSRADLAECLNAFQMAQMFFGAEFPSKSTDFHVVTDKFLDHCAGRDNVRLYPSNFTCNTVSELIRQVNRELLWTESKDVWCCNLEPVWGDFFGARAVGSNRPVPFLDAFPLTIWLHMNTKSSGVKNCQKFADIHGLAYVSNLVSVQLNHYQYLFLLRLSELVSEMATYLVVDSNKILKVESGGSLAIGALVPQVEVTFITPSQTPGKENSGGDLESVVPDSSSIADDLAGPSLTWQSTAAIARAEFGAKRLNTSYNIVTPESEVASTISMELPQHSTQTVVTFKQNGNGKVEPQHQNLSANSGTNLTRDDRNWNQSIDGENEFSKSSILKHQNLKQDATAPFIPNNFNVGLSSMKKGFANLMTSIDSALKASPEDGSSDTVSMRSDISSDSENYVVVSLEEQEKIDSVFGNLNPTGITTVEEACEVVEETPDTQSEKSMDSVCKRQDLVSMTTFKLSKMEIIQQSSGFSSSIKVQISNVASEECSSIPWDEFQTKFSSRSRGWVELPSDSDCRSRIKLRLDHGLKNKEDSRRLSQASQSTSEESSRRCSQDRGKTTNPGSFACNIDLHDKIALMAMFEDTLDVRVADVPLILSMSSVTGLADLAEDEIIPKPIPMEIFLENISLRLNKDRPPNNITSPGPIPINLAISRLRISRDIFLENISLRLNEDRPPNNITSPGPIPIDLAISRLKISRDVCGVFHIEPAANSISEGSSNGTFSNGQSSRNAENELELTALRQSSKQLKTDNEELRRRLATLERLSEENSRLRRVKEESESLKSRLTAAQEDITGLLKEKRVLQETVTDLRDQITRSSEPGNSNRASWSIKR